jgi:hypothetical protein
VIGLVIYLQEFRTYEKRAYEINGDVKDKEKEHLTEFFGRKLHEKELYE